MKNDKFILLLRKGIYPYEYMDNLERFNETKLPLQIDFYDKLNLQDITDEDYKHAQKVWDTFKIKDLSEYHDFYVQMDTLLLVDVFENFRNVCLNVYLFDPACLKKTRMKLELLTGINMLLIVEEWIRGGICQAIHKYDKANNKYMKNYNKNIISSFLMYLDAKNLYG